MIRFIAMSIVAGVVITILVEMGVAWWLALICVVIVIMLPDILEEEKEKENDNDR